MAKPKLSGKQIKQYREELVQEQQRLLQLLETGNGSSQLGRNPDRTDRAVSYGERERKLALSALEQQYLQQVEEALQRIDNGSFGYCRDCGQEIAGGRLEIMPHAAFCVACQRKHEQQIAY